MIIWNDIDTNMALKKIWIHGATRAVNFVLQLPTIATHPTFPIQERRISHPAGIPDSRGIRHVVRAVRRGLHIQCR